MLTDRRPILLANARVIDPSRDFDGPGDVLIADGVIREAKKGIGAAGVPEGTEVIDCRGKLAHAKTDRDREYFEQRFVSIDRQIDTMVGNLFGLDEKDISIATEAAEG